MSNVDEKTVSGFGDEWTRFDQSEMHSSVRQHLFQGYFSIFPWDTLPENSVGCDIGCGSGRWAMEVAPRVGLLHCIDPSSAIEVAKNNLKPFSNLEFHNVGVDDLPMPDASMDFAYSLGVLHHIPDTAAAMKACVNKLKPGAPFLVYLYYAFDNRPAWFRRVWQASDFARKLISRQPNLIRHLVCEILALLVYLPLAKIAFMSEKMGLMVSNWPLAEYRNRSFYVMRTDSLDRFGTRLENRFTRAQIGDMMRSSGLEDIRFSEDAPYWCAIGIRRSV